MISGSPPPLPITASKSASETTNLVAEDIEEAICASRTNPSTVSCAPSSVATPKGLPAGVRLLLVGHRNVDVARLRARCRRLVVEQQVELGALGDEEVADQAGRQVAGLPGVRPPPPERSAVEADHLLDEPGLDTRLIRGERVEGGAVVVALVHLEEVGRHGLAEQPVDRADQALGHHDPRRHQQRRVGAKREGRRSPADRRPSRVTLGQLLPASLSRRACSDSSEASEPSVEDSVV